MRALLMVAVLLSGCATQGTGQNWSPLIDRPGPNYAQDLAECQAHAARLAGAGSGAAGGALAGAALGAAFMAALGGSVGDGAIVGAFSGGGSGMAGAEMQQRGVISRCMTGRGYNVLQ